MKVANIIALINVFKEHPRKDLVIKGKDSLGNSFTVNSIEINPDNGDISINFKVDYAKSKDTGVSPQYMNLEQILADLNAILNEDPSNPEKNVKKKIMIEHNNELWEPRLVINYPGFIGIA